ncbi:MAG TPA: DNA polymerase III subunit alpha, partial [Fimbriimonas sp.]|nr:DNA polymerase III subunit alpha [Fimbriimonas sp.]
LLTDCHLLEPRLFPLCTWERLEQYKEGLSCLTGGATADVAYYVAKGVYKEAREQVERLMSLYGREHVYISVERSFLPYNQRVTERLLELAKTLNITPVASGPITHAERGHFPVQDMLSCIHSLSTIEEMEGRKPMRHPDQPRGRVIPPRALNAERYFRSATELNKLYADHPELLTNAFKLVESCEKHVLPPRTDLPVFCKDEEAMLRSIVLTASHGARKADPKLDKRVHKELMRIIRLGFARHFLTAWEMCNWASERRIHFSARGSVVDSVVAYYLGMSRINAWEHNLLFERFLPPDGSKRPDIDIDFEAEKRNDVRQHLSDRYGEKHVATISAIGAYNTRGIVRAVGKVMELPDNTITFLAKRIHGGVSPEKLEAALESRPELRDSNIPRERFRWVFRLAERMTDIPINMRAHSCGVVISADPIADTVPVQHSGIEDVPITQWDKRSSKHFFDKFDILCLRGQDVLSDTEESIRTKDLSFSVLNLPLDDPETYRAMRAGQLIGIPQSASPAMRQAHIRIRTENLTDASLVQAGIRPGVGGAVKINELIARRRGEPYSFLHPLLEKILQHTYGIVVFQEQIDELLQTFAGYSAGEAEEMRESIYKKRRESFANSVKREVILKIVNNGFAQKVAEYVFDLVASFEGYGFAQGHALAFAEISIRCIYLQQNFPAPYFAALLNAQPAGYYGPATITNEARIRGVTILPPDLNRSEANFVTEQVVSSDPALSIPDSGIRVGFKQIGGVSTALIDRILVERNREEFSSFFDFVTRTRPARDELEKLIQVGVLDTIHSNRRRLLWAIPSAMQYSDEVNGLSPNTLPLVFAEPNLPPIMDDFNPKEKAVYERCILGHDVAEHLMAFEREKVSSKGGIRAADVGQLKPGTKAMVVGNPIRLRFPPTKSGRRVVFFDLEDESGLANVTCFDETYMKYGQAIVCSQYVTILGEAQDRDGHIAFLAHAVFPYQPVLQAQLPKDRRIPLKAGDYLVG